MNENKYLIIIKNEDKTQDIISYENNKNLITIKYKNSEKTYSYSRKDVQWYNTPIEITIKNQKIILNGGYAYNVIKILKFENWYKLFFADGTSTVVPEQSLQLANNNEPQTLSSNKFDYYKEISNIVSVTTEEGKSLLTDEYEGINFISKVTALYKYLNPQTDISKKNVNLNNIIFPFGANKSQFQAVKNAMSSQISIIEGPPGTGKTQTILNIIANIVKNGQNVAVVSNNNAATDNVYEKLQKYHLDYLCARLGKRENKEEFINNQTGKYPIFEDKLENEDSIQNEILELNKSITKIFDIQNNIAKLREELNEIKLQHQYFNKHHNNINIPKIRNIKKITSKIVMKLKVEYEELKEINLWFRIKSQLLYGIGKKDFYKREREEIVNCYNRLFFIVKEMELEKTIKDNNKQLKELGKDKLNILIDDSIKILNEYFRKRYSQNAERKIYDIKDLYNKSQQFIEDYPIVFSTTYSIKKCLNKNFIFDYIIMDESSQVDLITGVLALSVAKNAVIVGDLKQLPNVVTTDNRNTIEDISKKYLIPSNYDYLEHSFLSSVTNTVTEAPKKLLQEHYRCHPKIIQFCNKKFYDGNLIVMTEDKGENNVLEAYVSAKGNHARGHKNIRQIDIIENEIMPKLKEEITIEDIGVISPYREQKKELEERFGKELKVDTIHKFQGREEEAIILTTVDNEIGEFVDDPKMLNVAVTRAKRFLRVVVSDSENNVGTNIDDLIKYIQYNNFEVVESKTKSIYDMLYKENRKQRMEYLKNKKRISDYDSENLTYNLIEEVIKENNFDNLDIVVHIPIMDILANGDLLNEEEKLYANNDWTHIDFAIFNKMDKKMVLAIEVDGYYYHKEGTKQQDRDKLKDRILEKYEVPLIRFSTVGSGEKKILEEKVREIFWN
ncbi:MAG: AAA family ATPase [Clostridia bacterium]|nr:AAA family ATPase [Clostridia bacterium]